MRNSEQDQHNKTALPWCSRQRFENHSQHAIKTDITRVNVTRPRTYRNIACSQILHKSTWTTSIEKLYFLHEIFNSISESTSSNTVSAGNFHTDPSSRLIVYVIFNHAYKQTNAAVVDWIKFSCLLRSISLSLTALTSRRRSSYLLLESGTHLLHEAIHISHINIASSSSSSSSSSAASAAVTVLRNAVKH